MIASLAYRRNADAIWNGQAPEKYTRLLPYISGRNILEFGAAEGVLSLLLANRDPGAKVTALEMRPERHQAAVELQERWRQIGRRVDGCTMRCGDIRDWMDLLSDADTVVAVRTIYYLRDSIEDVFAAMSRQVTKVVLCGNANRAKRYADGTIAKDDGLGPFNRYAGVDGMTKALTMAGYHITAVQAEGDPIVVGHR